MRKRKICVVTGTRAEYGALYWLIKEIENEQPPIEKWDHKNYEKISN